MPTNIDGEEVMEGYRGNLTPDQQVLLREMYRRLFDLYEENKERSAELEKLGGPTAAASNKASKKVEKNDGKDIPKGDDAKEEAKKAQELRDLKGLIDAYGGPYIRRALWEFCKHDNPDAALLRFLRARKWDIDRALAMLAAALKFRYEMDVQGILFKGEAGLDDPGFLNQFRRGISYIKGNTTAPGEHPIYFIHVARHFTNAQKHEVLQKFVLLGMEDARLLTTPPYEKAIVIFDMNGFGLKNMDWQCVLFLLKCLEAYYPESLQRIYIHGAPWIFKGIWQVLQPMLDPVVRDKIKFSSKAVELKDHADETRLRKGMGGTMDWDWDYLEPDPKENDLLKDEKTAKAMIEEYDELAKEFESVTKEWMKKENDDDEPDLTFKREVIAKQLRLTSYRMNRYTRARSVYQRTGIRKDDGSFTWEYPQQNGETITQTVNEKHSIPALRKWLQDHNEDTLDDSVCGRLGYCGSEVAGSKPGKSSVANNGNTSQKQQKSSKRDKEVEAGAAGGAAAGGGMLGAIKAKKDQAKNMASRKSEEPAPQQQQRQQTAEEDSEEEEEEEEAQPKPRQTQKKTSNAQEEQDQPQTYTGAAIGAITGAAAVAGGAAAGAVAYVRGEDTSAAQQKNGNAAAAQTKEALTGNGNNGEEAENDYDEDDYDDDDANSNYSEESITPETAIALSFIGDKPPTSSQVKMSDEECRKDLGLVREAMSLFLNSKMKEAEEVCIKGADVRLYKAEGMALINSVKSIMTFEPQDFETAIACCKHSMAIASLLRKKPGPLGKVIGGGKEKTFQKMSLLQQHAELVYAESMLLKAVLGIFYSGDSLAFVKHAFSLRNAYFLVRDLMKFVEFCDNEAEEAQIHNRRPTVAVDQDFRSGVYFSNGMCSLILSLLPDKALKMMEGLGFTGDRKYSLDLFARAGGWTTARPLPTISAEEEGVRRPLCDIAILVYHLVISAYVPVTDVDFEFADKVLSWNLVRFPNGIFFLYFSARLYAAQALPEKAIEYYRNAIESQSTYKQLHHLCFWDLSLTYLATCDFSRAYECYDVLSRESNWSKAIYQYAKAIMLYETGMDDRAKSATIKRTVSKLTKKIAGRQIPFERFVTLKAKKYIQQQNRLPLAALEFSYIWHCFSQAPVFLLVESTLTRIDEFIDELESYHDPKSYGSGVNEYWSAYCLAFFLRGVALRFVAYPEPHALVRLPSEDAIGPISEITADAKASFKKVLENGKHLDPVDRYLVYFAHYELGRLYNMQGKDDLAKHEFKAVLSGKSLEAKGKSGLGAGKASYLLSNMCIVRTTNALQTMKIQRGRGGGGSSTFFSQGSISSSAASSRTSNSTRATSMSSKGSRLSGTSDKSRSRAPSSAQSATSYS